MNYVAHIKPLALWFSQHQAQRNAGFHLINILETYLEPCQIHCMKNVGIRSFFWSVFGRFSRSDIYGGVFLPKKLWLLGFKYTSGNFLYRKLTNILMTAVCIFLYLVHILVWPFLCIAWKVCVFGVILVRIFSHSDWIWSDTASLRIQSECRKMRTRITPNTDTLYAVNQTTYLQHESTYNQ